MAQRLGTTVDHSAKAWAPDPLGPKRRCAGAGLGRFDRRAPQSVPLLSREKPARWRRFVICLPRSKTLHDPEPAQPRRIGEALIRDLRAGVAALSGSAHRPHTSAGAA